MLSFNIYCRAGVLNAGSTVYNSVKGKKERVGRLLEMHADSRTEIQSARAGDIVAIVGVLNRGSIEDGQKWEQPCH